MKQEILTTCKSTTGSIVSETLTCHVVADSCTSILRICLVREASHQEMAVKREWWLRSISIIKHFLHAKTAPRSGLVCWLVLTFYWVCHCTLLLTVAQIITYKSTELRQRFVVCSIATCISNNPRMLVVVTNCLLAGSQDTNLQSEKNPFQQEIKQTFNTVENICYGSTVNSFVCQP